MSVDTANLTIFEFNGFCWTLQLDDEEVFRDDGNRARGHSPDDLSSDSRNLDFLVRLVTFPEIASDDLVGRTCSKFGECFSICGSGVDRSDNCRVMMIGRQTNAR